MKSINGNPAGTITTLNFTADAVTPAPVVPIATPTAFDITNLSDQSLNTIVTTNTITVTGINVTVPVSTTLGTIVKNGVDTGLATTTVSVGNTVAIRLTTSASNSVTQSGVVTIGGVTDNFSVTTEAIIIPPSPTASGCTHDDTANTISCPPGVNPATIEVSMDNQATWIPYNASTTYLGNRTIFERIKSAGITPAGAATKHIFTNSAPVITSGVSVSGVFDVGTGGSIPAMTVTDADGDTLIYSLTGAPAGVTINSTTGVITIAGTV